jgi:hypothetical protein
LCVSQTNELIDLCLPAAKKMSGTREDEIRVFGEHIKVPQLIDRKRAVTIGAILEQVIEGLQPPKLVAPKQCLVFPRVKYDEGKLSEIVVVAVGAADAQTALKAEHVLGVARPSATKATTEYTRVVVPLRNNDGGENRHRVESEIEWYVRLGNESECTIRVLGKELAKMIPEPPRLMSVDEAQYVPHTYPVLTPDEAVKLLQQVRQENRMLFVEAMAAHVLTEKMLHRSAMIKIEEAFESTSKGMKYENKMASPELIRVASETASKYLCHTIMLSKAALVARMGGVNTSEIVVADRKTGSLQVKQPRNLSAPPAVSFECANRVIDTFRRESEMTMKMIEQLEKIHREERTTKRQRLATDE